MPTNIDIREALLRERAIVFYTELEKQCEGHGLWEGKLQDLMYDTKLPISARTNIVKRLVTLKCIEVVQTGNARQPTIIRPLRNPGAVEWADVDPDDEIVQSRLTRHGRYARLEAQMADLRRQIGGLDIPSVLNALNLRVMTVETRLNDLEKRLNG